MSGNNITSEQLKDLWDNHGGKEAFIENLSVASTHPKSFLKAFADIYEENLENTVLAKLLNCEVGAKKPWYEYETDVNFLARCATILDVKRGIKNIITELGIPSEIEKTMKGYKKQSNITIR